MLVGSFKTRLRSYLEQVSDVPLLADHVVMSFAASNLRRFTVHENLLDDKSHSAETVGIAILPDCVVVDFVHAIDETYLVGKFFISHRKIVNFHQLFTK